MQMYSIYILCYSLVLCISSNHCIKKKREMWESFLGGVRTEFVYEQDDMIPVLKDQQVPAEELPCFSIKYSKGRGRNQDNLLEKFFLLQMSLPEKN